MIIRVCEKICRHFYKLRVQIVKLQLGLACWDFELNRTGIDWISLLDYCLYLLIWLQYSKILYYMCYPTNRTSNHFSKEISNMWPALSHDLFKFYRSDKDTTNTRVSTYDMYDMHINELRFFCFQLSMILVFARCLRCCFVLLQN